MFEHAQFLKTMQTWVASYAPTHQLSAADLYYVLNWAKSGVRANELTDWFDRFLASHPDFFKDGVRLSRLQYEAEKLIVSKHKSFEQIAQEPLVVQDPFGSVLACITKLGQQTQNVFVRDALRQSWRDLRRAQHEAIQAHPDWQTSATEFYALKALAICATQQIVEEACHACFDTLAPCEKSDVETLSPKEQIHLMKLGPEASARFVKATRLQKIADRFGLGELLHFFDHA